jgi:membrane protein
MPSFFLPGLLFGELTWLAQISRSNVYAGAVACNCLNKMKLNAIKSKFTSLESFAKNLISNVWLDNIFDISAELAFWSILSLFPFMIFLLTLVGYLPVVGLEQELMSFIQKALPTASAQLVEQTIHEVVGKQHGWLLVLSVLGALWWSSSGVSATITALNRAYDVEETRPMWKAKVLSIAITVGAAVFIIVATGALLVGPDLAEKLFNYWDVGHQFAVVWSWMRWPIIVVAMMAMLALIYYFLPNIHQKFRIISPGAISTVALFLFATWLFNLYVAHFGSYAMMYGALGSVVILMMWTYILCSIVVIGGEINALFDKTIVGVIHREKVAGAVTRPDRGKDYTKKRTVRTKIP